MTTTINKLTFIREKAEENHFKVNQAFAYVVYFQLQKEMNVGETHQVIVDLTLKHLQNDYRIAYHDKPVREYLINIEPTQFTYEPDGSLYYQKSKELTHYDKMELLTPVPAPLKKYLLDF